MKSLHYEKFAGFSIPRILFFGIMGIVLLAIPSFAVNGAFYAVVGYLVLAGIFSLVYFIRSKSEKHFLNYASVAVSVILILFGICSMIFARYLVNVSPLYLGALFLIEGAYYFSVAPCGTGALRRSFLIILSMIVFLGGMGVIVFTLGFGVDGLYPALLQSCHAYMRLRRICLVKEMPNGIWKAGKWYEFIRGQCHLQNIRQWRNRS